MIAASDKNAEKDLYQHIFLLFLYISKTTHLSIKSKSSTTIISPTTHYSKCFQKIINTYNGYSPTEAIYYLLDSFQIHQTYTRIP